MTKSNREIIARIFKVTRPVQKPHHTTMEDLKWLQAETFQWRRCVSVMCEELKLDDPWFNPENFLRDCDFYKLLNEE